MVRRYQWRMVGGGILRLKEEFGFDVWPGQTFSATPSQIPEEYRSRVVKLGPAPPPKRKGQQKEEAPDQAMQQAEEE